MKLHVPTELTEEQISEYQEMYFKRFGEPISREDAIEEGLSLIRLVAIVLNEDYGKTNNKPSIPKG